MLPVCGKPPGNGWTKTLLRTLVRTSLILISACCLLASLLFAAGGGGGGGAPKDTRGFIFWYKGRNLVSGFRSHVVGNGEESAPERNIIGGKMKHAVTFRSSRSLASPTRRKKWKDELTSRENWKKN